MPIFVVDASVAIAGLSPDERHPAARELLNRAADAEIAVPTLWLYEVLNILAMKRRRQLIPAEAFTRACEALAGLPVVIHGATEIAAMQTCLELAQRRQLTVYDAAYLELALRLRLPLATLDRELIAAAKAEGCALLP